MILQSLCSSFDEQIEFQIKDLLSFMRFLDLQLWKKLPDAKIGWLSRERLKQQGLDTELFQAFDQMLKDRGYHTMNGQIVNATTVSAPHQQMTKEEKTG